jgi:hypothetical protein
MNASETELTRACVIYMVVLNPSFTLYKVSPVTIHVASFLQEGDGDVPSSEPSLDYP